METKMLKWKKKWYHQVRWRSLMWTPTLLSCCSSSSTRGRWAFWIQTQIHGICDQWSMIIFKHFFRFCFFIFSTLPQVASAAYTAELLYAADKYEIHGLVKTFPNQSWAILQDSSRWNFAPTSSRPRSILTLRQRFSFWPTGTASKVSNRCYWCTTDAWKKTNSHLHM